MHVFSKQAGLLNWPETVHVVLPTVPLGRVWRRSLKRRRLKWKPTFQQTHSKRNSSYNEFVLSKTRIKTNKDSYIDIRKRNLEQTFLASKKKTVVSLSFFTLSSPRKTPSYTPLSLLGDFNDHSTTVTLILFLFLFFWTFIFYLSGLSSFSIYCFVVDY